MENLRMNLREQGYDPDRLPLVIQYNKRDLPNIASLASSTRSQPAQRPEVEAEAHTGSGVFETAPDVIRWS